ncbi:MAG TPA: nucleoside triphosphate pyrophosphohydrolase [Beijerinckiaceae bacterium]|nr:nucleoside triphosphate pyrophosphohydrolase [Beijerinckiaceae bacterium]
MKQSGDIADLIAIMAALRTPETGCPWDLEQTFSTIVPYTIEEAYEVADAVERGDLLDLKEELGDLLLQVVFHSRLAEERGHFAFTEVVAAINAKMLRRHPHVFGTERSLSAADVSEIWAAIKAKEKADRQAERARAGLSGQAEASVIDGVPLALPGLTRAVKLQEKAAKVGFDWPDVRQVLDKIREEIVEIEAELAGGDLSRTKDEIGDLLFAVANLARHVKADAESALRRTNAKFERRFHFIERKLTAAGRTLEQATLDEMEALWQAAKAEEKTTEP